MATVLMVGGGPAGQFAGSPGEAGRIATGNAVLRVGIAGYIAQSVLCVWAIVGISARYTETWTIARLGAP